MKKFMILPLLLVVLVSFAANAKGPGKKDWQWWQNEKIATELNLSQDQTTQINDIAAKFDPILKEARGNFTEKKTAFIDAKSNPDTSSGDVIKSFDSMWDSKYKMKRVKLDRDLEIKGVLTTEQTNKLSEIRKAHKEKMMRKHHKKHPEMMDKKPNE